MANETAKEEPELSWEEMRPQMIKLALELGPLVVFFLANMWGEKLRAVVPLFQSFDDPIYIATILFMAAMVISLGLSWVLLKRIAVMPLVTGIVVLIFGALTIALRDPSFIKLKPTITNLLFAGTLLGGLAFKQSLLKYVFGDVYKLQPKGWTVLTVRWGVFFLVLAILNEVVWRNFSTDIWVAFKVWGIMPLTVIFSIFQLPVLTKYAPVAEPAPIPVPPVVSDL